MGRIKIYMALGLFVTLGATASARAEKLQNQANRGWCLGIAGGNMTNGTSAVLWPCDGTPNQDWDEGVVRGGSVFFSNRAGVNKCLSDYNYGNNSHAFINDCGTSYQMGIDLFAKDDAGNGCFYLRANNDRVLSVLGGNITWGQPIVVYDKLTPVHNDQVWCPVP